MKLVALFCLILVPVLGAAGPFSTSRVKAGRFVYRDTQHGKVIGTFTLSVRPQADGITIFTGDAEGFHQHWRAATAPDFAPLFAELRIGRDNGRTYAMDVWYENGAAHGVIGYAPDPDKSTSAPVPSDTVDQRLDWAAMLSSTLNVGQELRFHVYDPDSGLTPVVGRALGIENLAGPAGAQAALRLRYTMAKAGGAESYDILVSRDAPRVMLREEFPDGTVTELIEIQPAGN